VSPENAEHLQKKGWEGGVILRDEYAITESFFRDTIHRGVAMQLSYLVGTTQKRGIVSSFPQTSHPRCFTNCEVEMELELAPNTIMRRV
jgi:hypothetical protein